MSFVRRQVTLVFVMFISAIFLTITFSPLHAEAILNKDQLELHGWLRQYTSVNLQDAPETRGDDSGDISMLRGSAWLDGQLDFGGKYGQLGLVVRGDQEVNSDFLDKLEDSSELSGNPAFGTGNPGNADNDRFDDIDVRELFWKGTLSNSIDLKIGRQLVAWGKTDFFQAMDVIHGFDNTWHTFLAPDEERRKPLTMVNATVDISELNSQLQLIYRPGVIDDEKDIGNDEAIFGGRWAGTNRGLDFTESATNFLSSVTKAGPEGPQGYRGIPFDREHPEGDGADANFGARYYSTAFDNSVEWSIAYWHGPSQATVINTSDDPFKGVPVSTGRVNPAPVFNFDFNGNGVNDTPFDGPSTRHEFINPFIDVVGGSANYYHAPFDAVFRTEIAYKIDQPFNTVSNPNTPTNPFPGAGPIVERDVVSLMLNMDKQLSLQEYVGTYRPSLFSVQVFDDWVIDDTDRIVQVPGNNILQDDHSVIVTGILNLNYNLDRFNVGLAGGLDATYGGAFFIPSTEFRYGDHWRLDIQGEFFFEDDNPQNFGEVPFNNGSAFDLLANSNQVFTRVTYQF